MDRETKRALKRIARNAWYASLAQLPLELSSVFQDATPIDWLLLQEIFALIR